jgi:hypothetical protein
MALNDIRVKLDRAKEHLDAFNTDLDRFVKEKPYPLHVVTESDTSKKVSDVEWTRGPPARWSAIVGDCVHNLRSVLDHIVWDLSGGTGHAPKHSEFPVFDDSIKYFERTKKGTGPPARGSGLWKIDGVSNPYAIAAIRRLQPFQRPDPARHPLWIIHELDRLDKHRALHVIWGIAYDYVDLLSLGIGDAGDFPPGLRQVGATYSPLYRAQTPPGTKTKVKVRFDLAVRVTLPPQTVGAHENLDVLLGKLIGFVETDVVPTFAPWL